MRTILSIAAALLAATSATSATAQHAGHGSPYAELTKRDIKALSAQDREGLLEGRGMTLALPAELNGYPGPLHVLEHADALALDAGQREATARLMHAHKAEARALGAQLVDAERALDRAFATRGATPESIAEHTQRIAQLQARLRASHLQAHLAQTALLAPHQVARYQVLRGYAQAPATHRGHGSHK